MRPWRRCLIVLKIILTFGRREKLKFMLMHLHRSLPLHNPQPFPSTFPPKPLIPVWQLLLKFRLKRRQIPCCAHTVVYPSLAIPDLLVTDVMCPSYLTFDISLIVLFSLENHNWLLEKYRLID